MITNKTFETLKTGERVTKFFQGDVFYAKIIRRTNRRTFDVVFAPELNKQNVRGCKSKAEAENALF